MSEIDWSKAAEGATHWAPATDRLCSSFMKLENGQWFCQKANGHGWVLDESNDCPCRYIARPSAWSGVGLPPVGTVCEVKSGYGGIPTFMPCEVIAHFDGETRRCAAYVYTQHDGTRLVGQGTEQAFRPLRTPEQIAAEERKQAIAEMVYGACGAEPDGANTTAFMICGLLYDSGYRKVEGGAA